MANDFDSEFLEFPCPQCRKNIKQTVRWFKGNNLACPNCKLPIDAKQFKAGIEKVEKEWAALKRKLGGK